jgi:uncharacterized membrane protein YphA (DoxX/SURF4 family)
MAVLEDCGQLGCRHCDRDLVPELGIWKISDPHGWAVRLAQAKVPAVLSLPGALFFGITETVAGVLILVPRLRRWGAILASLLLVAFLIYFAIYFNELRGMDCSCFPLAEASGRAGLLHWRRRYAGTRHLRRSLGEAA